jgi:hypothetical protein
VAATYENSGLNSWKKRRKLVVSGDIGGQLEIMMLLTMLGVIMKTSSG